MEGLRSIGLPILLCILVAALVTRALARPRGGGFFD
jgi:hypothetical protein